MWKTNQFIFTLRIQSTAKTEEGDDFGRHVNPYWLSKPRFVLFVGSNHHNLVLHVCLEAYIDTVFKGEDYSWLVQPKINWRDAFKGLINVNNELLLGCWLAHYSNNTVFVKVAAHNRAVRANLNAGGLFCGEIVNPKSWLSMITLFSVRKTKALIGWWLMLE